MLNRYIRASLALLASSFLASCTAEEAQVQSEIDRKEAQVRVDLSAAKRSELDRRAKDILNRSNIHQFEDSSPSFAYDAPDDHRIAAHYVKTTSDASRGSNVSFVFDQEGETFIEGSYHEAIVPASGAPQLSQIRFGSDGRITEGSNETLYDRALDMALGSRCEDCKARVAALVTLVIEIAIYKGSAALAAGICAASFLNPLTTLLAPWICPAIIGVAVTVASYFLFVSKLGEWVADWFCGDVMRRCDDQDIVRCSGYSDKWSEWNKIQYEILELDLKRNPSRLWSDQSFEMTVFGVRSQDEEKRDWVEHPVRMYRDRWRDTVSASLGWGLQWKSEDGRLRIWRWPGEEGESKLYLQHHPNEPVNPEQSREQVVNSSTVLSCL